MRNPQTKCDTYLRRYFRDIAYHLNTSLSSILKGSTITPQRFYELSTHTYVRKIFARDLFELNRVIRQHGLHSTPEILYELCDICKSEKDYLNKLETIMDMKGNQFVPPVSVSDGRLRRK